MIIGGADVPRGPASKRARTPATEEGSGRERPREEILVFSEEDLEAMMEPHNDALVISFLSNNTRIKRVIVDPGSSVNIIRSEVVGQLGLLNQVIPTSRVLHGFNMVREETKGEIIIPIDTSGTTQNTEFQVINGDMKHNAVLGRPWIHNIRVVPSTLHQVIRFPTRDGITTIHGEQQATREMFAVHHETTIPAYSALDGEGSAQTLEDDEEDFFAPRTFVSPKESDETKSTVEELEQTVLIKHLPDRKVYLGTGLTPELRAEFIQFLSNNIDYFAWSHLDMTGIPPEITSHKLSVDPKFKPVKQKRRPQSEMKHAFIKEEVAKLLKIGSIREVKYPEWLANVFVVPKKGNKLRMCVDYKDLNKACPKGSFLLPNIDRLIDAMAGHETLTFLDAYSRYNQIQMNPEDREKTSYITKYGTYCYIVMPFRPKKCGSNVPTAS
ncbi:PREDICTED: uncharacterized protein LOC109233529 [Nicotiana attenuata]|uniref:uncharacterized protein LOC109233529 n=1 Tax=Nicotiana attenuata TaxID=49451 RepID=UPI000904A93B|nr:PREDICTED: uncharacterized protein LOC109233529 [Nicotiana attenuata]